ncbi:unnamed protein product, partial [Mesorhabditis spiculigera]
MMLKLVICLLIAPSIIEAEMIRENRTVAIFELLNDVFSVSQIAGDAEASPVKTLEMICIDSALSSHKPENAPWDLAQALVEALRAPRNSAITVDADGPCWPLLLVRAARTLLFTPEALDASDLADLDEKVAELRTPYFQSRPDADRWQIAQKLIKTLTFEMPRDFRSNRLISRLQAITTGSQNEADYIQGLVELISLMFHYKIDAQKYVEAL